MYSEVLTEINNKSYLDLGTAIVNSRERNRKNCSLHKEGVHNEYYWHGLLFSEGIYIKRKDIEKINTCLLFNKPSNSFYIEVLTSNNYICRVFLNTAVKRAAEERLRILSAAEGFIVYSYSGHGIKPAGLGEILCNVIGIIHSESKLELEGGGFLYLIYLHPRQADREKIHKKIKSSGYGEDHSIFTRDVNELGYIKEFSDKFLDSVVSFLLG